LRAPSYIDYLTDRAIATHNLNTPEGKVGAANAVLPYLAKVPNPLLRAELANRLAQRLRLDERLLREELRRAPGEGRRQLQVGVSAVEESNHAVKQLLRACLGSQEVADAVLPEVISSGAVQGLPGEGIFTRLWEARKGGDRLDVTSTEANLSEAERKLALEALFSPVEQVITIAEGATDCIAEFIGAKARAMGCDCECPKCQAKRASSPAPSSADVGENPPRDGRVAAASDLAMGAIRALRLLQLLREQRELAREIKAAENSQDAARLAALHRTKEGLDRALQQLTRRRK
jgi:DNA primase